MSLGEVVRLWGAVDLVSNIRILGHIDAAALRLSNEFEHWAASPLQYKLYDTSRHEMILVTPNRVAFECVNPPNLATTAHNLAKHVETAITELHPGELKRIGVKLSIHCGTMMKFAELMDRMRAYCLPENEQMFELTSSNIVDVAMNYHYRRDGLGTGMLRAGPMEREQSVGFLRSTGDLNSLFEPLEKSDELAQLFKGVPEACFYFDLDVFQKPPEAKWRDFVKGTVEHAIEVFNGMKSLILETSK